MEPTLERNERDTIIEVVSRLELAGQLPTKEAILPDIARALRLPFSDAARVLVRAVEAGYLTRVGPPGLRAYHLTPSAWLRYSRLRLRSA